MEELETEKYLGYTISIGYQNYPQDPRETCEHFGTIVYNHGRYNLGDKKLTEYGDSFERDLLHELYPDMADDAENGDIDFEDLSKKLSDEYYFIPLKLYDHSGIHLSTGLHGEHETGSGWDSGMVGYIYISKSDAKKEYEGFTEKEVEKKAYDYMEGEIKMYNSYLTGEIYSYDIDYIDELDYIECYSIEEAIKEAKEYINNIDPEGKILKEATEIYEIELDNFWDSIGERASDISTSENGEEDDYKRSLIIGMVGIMLRAY